MQNNLDRTEEFFFTPLKCIKVVLIFTAFHNKLTFPRIQRIFLFTSRGVVRLCRALCW